VDMRRSFMVPFLWFDCRPVPLSRHGHEAPRR
jgi:hypothetical protein